MSTKERASRETAKRPPVGCPCLDQASMIVRMRTVFAASTNAGRFAPDLRTKKALIDQGLSDVRDSCRPCENVHDVRLAPLMDFCCRGFESRP